jgi:oligopeptide transport system permease protein
MLFMILRRVASGIPVLLIVATLTFILMHIVPGGPFDHEKRLPPEILHNIEVKFHLDRPVWEQYVLYMKGLLVGDFGPSYKYLGRNVADILADTWPVSFLLGSSALAVTVLLGLFWGILMAIRQKSWVDRIGSVISVSGISVPNFVAAALLILVFAHTLKILPPALWEDWRHLILPTLALSLAPAAYVAQLTRNSLIDVLHQDYIRTARAKGLREGSVILRHALKNGLMPVVTVLGPITASLVTGSFVVEYLFAIPGMGRHFIMAVVDRDYPLIMGVTLVYATVIVAANLIVDLVYGLMDPRVRR